MNYNGSTATALAGHELHELDYGSDGSMLRQMYWTSEPDCQPTGFPISGGGPPNNPGDNYLISQLDQNNPVVACDPRVDQEDTYLMDGVTNITDPRVVHTQVNYTYDGDDQGVTPYDYGNISDTSTSGADLGTGVYVDAHDTTYPHDNIDGGIFLTDLPAVSQIRNGSGTPSSCSQFVYGNLSQYNTSPDVPGITQAQTHTVGGTSGCGNSSNQINVLHSYDTSGNPISSTDGDNHTGCTIGSSSYSACATYDASTYDTHIVSAANALNQQTSSVYDPGSAGGFGQWLTSLTDVNGQVTTYQYDALGRLTATVQPGDSPSSPTISYTYLMTCSQGATTPCIELDTSVRYTIGGPTSTTKQWYDGWGRLIETQAPSPNNGQTIVTYTVYYNDGTNGTEVIASMPYAIATQSGYVAPDLSQARSVTKYDGLGRSEGVTTYYSGGSNIAMASTNTYTVGQGVSGISNDSSTAFERTSTYDSYNHQSIVYTDALGRTRYSQLYSGINSYSMVRTVGYTYDILGDMTSTTTYDANGNVKASYAATFDAVKRLTGYNDSDLGACSNSPLPPGCQNSADTAWHFTYDADNNQLSQIDPRNQTIYASYDNLDRPLCRGTTSASVNPCQNSTYALYFYDSYNNTSNPSVTFPAGCTAPSGSYTSAPVGHATAEVFSSSAGSGWRCYGYDQRGELDQTTLSVTADGHSSTNTMNMSYNDGGELASLVYPDQETLTSQYDTDGHLLSVYFGTPSSPDPVNFLAGQVSYNNNGLLAGLAMGGSGPKGGTPSNSVFSTSYGYDGIQRPQSSSVTESGNTLWSQSRTYDNVGNVLQLATVVPTQSGGSLTDNQSFCYDALDRLAWAGNTGSPSGGDHCGTTPTGSTTPTYQQSFSYDSLDRLTSGPAGTMSYDSTHVHAADSASSFPNQYASYDAMGNMTCRNVDTGNGHTCGNGQTGTIMTYDNEGRLATWAAPSGTTATDSFLYDNEGNRVLQRTSTTSGGTTTVSDIITFDTFTDTTITNGSASVIKYYTLAGQPIAMATGNRWYTLVPDLLGSTSLAINGSGAVQAVQLFAPYGSVRYSDGTIPTPHNFTGQRLDSQTGLLYYNARYYDAAVGTFLAADSVEGNPQGSDPYVYGLNNPETYVDPTGRVPALPGDDGPDLQTMWYILINVPSLFITYLSILTGQVPPGSGFGSPPPGQGITIQQTDPSTLDDTAAGKALADDTETAPNGDNIGGEGKTPEYKRRPPDQRNLRGQVTGNGLKKGKGQGKATLNYQLPSADMLRIGLALHLENEQSYVQINSSPQATTPNVSVSQVLPLLQPGIGSVNALEQAPGFITGAAGWLQGAGNFLQSAGDWFSNLFDKPATDPACACGPDEFPGRFPGEEEDPGFEF